jgi:membrane protein
MDNFRGIVTAVTRSAVRHRIAGHSAELAFFAVVALVPATVTVGGAMRVVALVLGEESQAREAVAAVSTIRFLIGPGLGDSVIVPFVRAQLDQEHGGLALGGLLVTWWLFSHLFNSTSHALDTTYDVADRRGTPVLRLLAMAHALAAVVVITLTLAVMSAVPLPFSDEASSSTVVDDAESVWTVARWPLLALVLVLALTGVYRFGPDVRHSFRQCVPGAILAVGLLAVMIVGFRLYLQLGFGAPTGVISHDPEIILIGHAVAAVVATAFFVYFASYAVLMGAELNAELYRRSRPGAPPEGVDDQRPSVLDVRHLFAPLLARAAAGSRSKMKAPDADNDASITEKRPAQTTTGRAVRIRPGSGPDE